jgi:hypothetical protein
MAGSFVVIASVVGTVFLVTNRDLRAGLRAPSDTSEEAPPAQRGTSPSFVGSSSDSEAQHLRTIQRMQAELAEKDAKLAKAELELAAKRADQTVSESTRVTQRAMQILEERMLAGGSDGAAAQRERTRLEAAVHRLLPQGFSSEVFCGSSMCRVLVRSDKADGSNVSKVSATMAQMADEAGKSYPATQVLYDEQGEASLYLAKSSEQLDTDPVSPEQAAKVPRIVYTGEKATRSESMNLASSFPTK